MTDLIRPVPEEKRAQLSINSDGSDLLMDAGETQKCTWAFDCDVQKILDGGFPIFSIQLTLADGSSLPFTWLGNKYDTGAIWPTNIRYEIENLTYTFYKPYVDIPQSRTSVVSKDTGLLEDYRLNEWTAYALVNESGAELIPADKASKVNIPSNMLLQYTSADGFSVSGQLQTSHFDEYCKDGKISFRYSIYDSGNDSYLHFWLCLESGKPVYLMEDLDEGRLFYLSPEGRDYVERPSILPY